MLNIIIHLYKITYSNNIIVINYYIIKQAEIAQLPSCQKATVHPKGAPPHTRGAAFSRCVVSTAVPSVTGPDSAFFRFSFTSTRLSSRSTLRLSFLLHSSSTSFSLCSRLLSMKGEVTWCQLGTWGAREGSKDWGASCTFSLYFASRGTVTEQALALVQFGLPGSAQRTRSSPCPSWSQVAQVHCPSFPVVPPWLISTHHPSPCSTCAAPQHFLQLPPLLAQLGELSPDFILLLLQPLLLLRKPLHLCLRPVLAQLGFHCCRWKHNPPNQAQPGEKPGGKTSSGAWKQNE